MITDEKTQNRLYADTDTVLFTLEDKTEAVHKMMEIIKDTPEYLQLMNHLPAYAQDNPKADWWQTEDADYLVADLLHVLRLYTPEGFIFGPITGRTYGFGYGNREFETKRVYRIEIYLDWGYRIGQKDQYRKKKRHYAELERYYAELEGIYRAEGYTTELNARAKGCRIAKGNTQLHAHYSWITGHCEAIHLCEFLLLLLKKDKKFRFIKCEILDGVYDFTEEEEYEFYRQRNESNIYYQIFDLFKRKSWPITESLMEIAWGINISTKIHPEGLDCNSPAYKYVLSAYGKLLDKGYLEEYTRTLGKDEFRCARATKKGISKNIFYGTQL